MLTFDGYESPGPATPALDSPARHQIEDVESHTASTRRPSAYVCYVLARQYRIDPVPIHVLLSNPKYGTKERVRMAWMSDDIAPFPRSMEGLSSEGSIAPYETKAPQVQLSSALIRC